MYQPTQDPSIWLLPLSQIINQLQYIEDITFVSMTVDVYNTSA